MGAIHSSRGKSEGTWKKEVKPGDKFMVDPKGTDLVIAIMGATGSGKSTFINTLLGKTVAVAGHSLKSQTVQVQAYLLQYPQPSGTRIVIVDTPGFDDTAVSDREILRRIAIWLARSYEANMKLAGIIYLYDISHTRWERSSGRSFNLFEKLCGEAATKKIVLATTMWDKVTPEDGDRREQELRSDIWKDMVERGSTIHRVSSPGSGRAIIDFLLAKNDFRPIKIQREMVDSNKGIAETKAGRTRSDTFREPPVEAMI
ncbi:hypothetical protein C0991_008259 [Blastosporella zonata]|nr:hypothetical protein C0991_008259 [Blastosporella zonata]